ncbi:MAG: response regulator, partial [Bacteroidota bacterium]|nr:response regulator [Bacteroidota bacterium]
KLSLNLIKKNVSLLMQLINHVSDLQKSDQKSLKLSVSVIELIGFIQSVINSFKGMAEQKNIQLILEVTSSENYVWLDAEKLKLIFYYLFSRAIKSSNRGTSILVPVKQKESAVQIKVTGQKLGFSDDERENVFNGSSPSKRNKKTLGKYDIGFPLVKNLVELQKGKIELEKKEGESSCFTLTFQQGKDHFSAEEIKNSENDFIFDQTKPDLSPTFMNDIGDQKILIVEDNPDMIDFLVLLLEKYFALKAANNGQEALEMIPDFMPDLIISDIMIPAMNGIDFCKQVKNNIKTSHIPIILLSSKTDIKTHVDSLETGADAYIEKPFYSPLLLANIHSLLKNREYIKAQFNVSDLKFSLPNQLSKQDRNFIKMVNEIIESKLADPLFNVEELSKKANMSRATFYRKFTGLIGINPADYIRKNRLKKAYALIKDKQLNISRVAEYTGFLSVSQFRKSFKKEFGKTPSEIQKKQT